MQRFKFFVILILLLFYLPTLFAGTSGKIVGTIKDKSSGEGLIGANILLEGTMLGASTDEDGYYVIINVPPGTYTLTVVYIGYAESRIENVRVSVDRTTTRHVQLTTEALSGDEIIVQAERPAIEMDRTHTAAIVSSESVEAMPVTEIEEVLEIQAGVVNSNGELHFRGGRSREVSYIVDGIPVTNSFSQAGGSMVEVDNNMIEELEVISGTFNAEYGQAQSGVVNIVTKRPATTFKGTLNTYIGDWVSTNDDVFIGIKEVNPFAEKNIQGSLTGPIIKNRLGFVVNARYHGYQNVDWYERRFNTIDGWKIEAYRKWAQQNNVSQGTVIPIPDSLATGNGEMGPLSETDYGSMQAKLLLTITPQITLTYTAFGSFEETRGALDPLDRGGDQFFKYAPDDFGTYREWSYSQFLRWQHSLSENFYYNIAVSYQREDADFFYRKDNKLAMYPGDDGIQLFTATSSNSGGRQFSLGGTGNIYTGQDGEGYQDQYLLQGDMNWQIDKYNLIKAGFQVKQMYSDVYAKGFRQTQAWQNNRFPTNSVLDPADFQVFGDYWNALDYYWQNWEQINGNANRIEEVGPEEVALYRDYQNNPLEMSAYIQDKLELGGQIIINGGVRLDVFQPNELVPINFRTESFNLGSQANLKDATVKSQLSPRIGISFPISSSGAFHGSYGHFFQMPPYNQMFNEPLQILSRTQLDGRLLGNADLKPEKTIIYEIGLQQSVTSSIGVDVTMYYKDFRNLLGIDQQNTIDGVQYLRYINRDYGSSKGVTVDFTKRSGMVTGGLSYTLAFAKGSSSDPAALTLIQAASRLGAADEVFPERKVLYLNWDQRHALKTWINIESRDSWSLGIQATANSGSPYTPGFLERFDLVRREFRNAATRPMQYNMDVKFKKRLHFAGVNSALFVKVDNLFDNLNHENVFSVSGKADEVAQLPEELARDLSETREEGIFTFDEIYSNPDFFSRPRRVQIGLEVQF